MTEGSPYSASQQRHNRATLRWDQTAPEGALSVPWTGGSRPASLTVSQTPPPPQLIIKNSQERNATEALTPRSNLYLLGCLTGCRFKSTQRLLSRFSTPWKFIRLCLDWLGSGYFIVMKSMKKQETECHCYFCFTLSWSFSQLSLKRERLMDVQ